MVKRTAKRKEWVVTTTGGRPLAEVRKDVSAGGFKVEQVLDQIGILIGKATPAVAKKIRKIPGVADVSAPPKADIGPPDAPIQ